MRRYTEDKRAISKQKFQFIPSSILYRSFFLFCFFLFFNSCVFGSGVTGGFLSSNVDIIVSPYGVKDTRFARNPVIFLSPGEKVCRFYPYRAFAARSELSSSGLKEEFLDILFGATAEEIHAAEDARNNQNQQQNNSPVRVNVEANWIEFGLFIQNKNTGKNAYHLLVQTIKFISKAECGEQTFSHSGDVSTGYCLADGGGVPTLSLFYTLWQGR